MDKYDIARINKELKDIMHDFNESYKFHCRASREQYMKTLRPGSPIPAEGRIYTEECKNAYEVDCAKLRERARNTLSDCMSKLKTKVTDAPSAEAVNSIGLLKIRNDVKEDELKDLVDRYGDNVQAYKAISSIAEEHGIYVFGKHPAEVQMQMIDDLAHSLNKALVPHNDKVSDGLIALYNLHIDQTFPVEE